MEIYIFADIVGIGAPKLYQTLTTFAAFLQRSDLKGLQYFTTTGAAGWLYGPMGKKHNGYFRLYYAEFFEATDEMSDRDAMDYLRMLAHQFNHGYISQVALDKKFRGVSQEVISKFDKDQQGNLLNDRMTKERERQIRATEAARKRVKKRWAKSKQDTAVYTPVSKNDTGVSRAVYTGVDTAVDTKGGIIGGDKGLLPDKRINKEAREEIVRGEDPLGRIRRTASEKWEQILMKQAGRFPRGQNELMEVAIDISLKIEQNPSWAEEPVARHVKRVAAYINAAARAREDEAQPIDPKDKAKAQMTEERRRSNTPVRHWGYDAKGMEIWTTMQKARWLVVNPLDRSQRNPLFKDPTHLQGARKAEHGKDSLGYAKEVLNFLP